jgi:tetratricopeptide (TPR) repeat protein
MREGNNVAALEILEAGLEITPYSSKLHLNVGIVLEKLGRDEEALEHLRRSAELDPYSSGAPGHIERIEQKLKERKPDENE